MHTKDRHKLYKVQNKLNINNCELKISDTGKKKPDKNSIILIRIEIILNLFL